MRGTTWPRSGMRNWGADDDTLFARCRQEGRCLVTLDLDFSNVLRVPPEQTAGLVGLRLAGKPTLAAARAPGRTVGRGPVARVGRGSLVDHRAGANPDP
jgi:Domain of unknown function (DUF5615)